MPINTGKLVYQWLIQIDETTGLPTGLRKPNDPGDADYFPPVEDPDACPIPYTWQPMDEYCTKISGAGSNNTGYKAYQNRRRLLANVPDGYVEPNAEWDGLGPYFPPVYDPVSCPIVVTELQAFDYCVVTYSWLDTDGVSLDVFGGGRNTASQFDDRWVGRNASYQQLPYNYPPQDAFYAWTRNNLGTGQSILFNFKRICEYGLTNNIIEMVTSAVWNLLRDGNVTMRIKTYLGGTMTTGAVEFLNSGGTLVQDLTLSNVVTAQGSNGQQYYAENVAVIRYNQSTLKATIQLV